MLTGADNDIPFGIPTAASRGMTRCAAMQSGGNGRAVRHLGRV
ncbi:hypothetical protein F8B43_5414 [Methylorubrum populi]|uniref:Uncharacterized protein n=1 Tax=Methylorubrum populi TaxID=223967 RepID=A0A833J1X1_9HYPH|nr:hypothetical protein F8B43_5414 [Methylorubrum populi]